MKNIIHSLLYLPMSALLLAATLSDAGAESAATPFKGKLNGTFTVTPLEFPEAFVLIEATGKATHLGLFTMEGPHLVSFFTFTGAGTYEFTAANGDTLSATFTGLATPTENPGELSIVEFGTITGGTGRFANATGSFTLVRLANAFDPTSGSTSGAFEGSILIPGAN